MITFGMNNLIAFDSTFGTNKVKVIIFSLFLFKAYHHLKISNACLLFYCILCSPWIYKIDPTWRTSAFMVDDDATEINAISGIFRCRILLCLWHVHRSWLNNMTKKCHDYMERREMFKDLGDIIYNQSHATNLMETIDYFKHKY
eukprot:Gb_28984 [translate_table: standard]